MTTATAEAHYLWCGDQICQARDAQDSVTARYFGQGELQGNTALYYVRDHLGSVANTVSALGLRLGRLTYGPYGETLKADGKLPDMRYAGMLQHAATGLYATHYRFYDPNSARWLNRDPIGEDGGINLYAYVGGNPLSGVDPTGLNPLAGAYAGAGVGSAFGPVGTVVGGIIGAGVGAWLGWNVVGPMFSQSKTPNNGEPGSCHVNPGSGQERQYGSDGKPDYDIDWDHDHGQGVPHGHNWGRGPNGEPIRGPGVPVSPWPAGRGPGG